MFTLVLTTCGLEHRIITGAAVNATLGTLL
jgi:hypothetical protein